MLPTSAAQGLSIAAAIVIGVPVPLTPIQVRPGAGERRAASADAPRESPPAGADREHGHCRDARARPRARGARARHDDAAAPQVRRGSQVGAGRYADDAACSVHARLVGGTVAWRTLLVGVSIIIAMLGAMAWERASNPDYTEGQGHAVAMNTLVISQVSLVLPLALGAPPPTLPPTPRRRPPVSAWSRSRAASCT